MMHAIVHYNLPMQARGAVFAIQCSKAIAKRNFAAIFCAILPYTYLPCIYKMHCTAKSSAKVAM